MWVGGEGGVKRITHAHPHNPTEYQTLTLTLSPFPLPASFSPLRPSPPLPSAFTTPPSFPSLSPFPSFPDFPSLPDSAAFLARNLSPFFFLAPISLPLPVPPLRTSLAWRSSSDCDIDREGI